jgi:membrane-bound lytic murein transglycosylase B
MHSGPEEQGKRQSMGNSNVASASLMFGALLFTILPAAAQSQASRAPIPTARPAASEPVKPERPALPTSSYGNRPEVQAFIDRLVQAHGFDRPALQALFARLKPSERVVQLMTPTTGGSYRRSWREYRARFVQPARIDGGLAFWQDNGADLRLASAMYGVPEEIIVAIIGVETLYGRNTGRFPVAEALATLAFDYPSRADYFRSELEQFLLYARENRIDPLEPLGSYAGAIGTPQFMPGSIRRFAVDLDKDGLVDLRNGYADAIGSVANFLAQHGWVPGKPTHFPVTIEDPAKARPFIDAGPVPQSSIVSLAEAGITSSVEIPADEKLVLVDLVNVDGPADHVLGTRNFYAITRYNRSYFYAMAVIDLAAELRRRRSGEAAPQ